MGSQLQTGTNRAGRLDGGIAPFESWLILTISGVLFADKAGELLVLSPGQFRLDMDSQLDHIRTLSTAWKLSCQVLWSGDDCARVVIYNSSKVQRAFSETPLWFFEKLGYRRDVAPSEFLEEVGKRWRREGRIPDEVGLALGYPVKDVLGYMGHLALPCTGSCGWRIYGNPEPSLWKSLEFKKGRDRALSFLNCSSTDEPPERTGIAAPTAQLQAS